MILPSAKAVYVCDFHVGYSNGKIDLYGQFEAIRPKSYPHHKGSFTCVVQLVGGLGDVPFHIDIRRAADGVLVDCSDTQTLRFPNRETLLKVARVMNGCVFDQPGVYLVELYCDNTWVADTTLRLLEVST
jgi:hypothetical protein